MISNAQNKAVPTPDQEWFFPTHGVTIKAPTKEEAEKKLPAKPAEEADKTTAEPETK